MKAGLIKLTSYCSSEKVNGKVDAGPNRTFLEYILHRNLFSYGAA